MDAWEPYDSGGEINRLVEYCNLIANHIKTVQLTGYNDGTYSIEIEAGENSDICWGIGTPTVEHNQSLITKLQERNFNADTANVTRYPTIDNRYYCYFAIRGTLDDIAQQFDSMLGIVEDLEGPGSTQGIRNEMLGRFQPAPPQLN